jgi:hypothetical protein
MRYRDRRYSNGSIAVMAWIAALLFLGALSGFAAALEGYAHAIHPVALPGARGVANGTVFNLLAFVLPGGLLAAVAWRLRQAMPGQGAWSARIGAWLALLSALGFVAQGLLPLDPRDLDAIGSRLHAVAWTLWWVAFVPASVLLAHASSRGRRHWILAALGVSAAAMVAWLALSPPTSMATGIAQRMMLGAWFGWWVLVARHRHGLGQHDDASAVADLQRQDGRGEHEGDRVGDDHRP